MVAVHQFLATFEPGATGNHALLVQRALRDAGYESELFAEFSAPGWRAPARDHTDYGRRFPARDDDVLLYQMSTGSAVADFVLERREPLIVNYHNFTPPEFFERWEPPVVHGIAWGRHQRDALAGRAALGVADSAFNEVDLTAAGYRATAVCPVLIDPAEFLHEPDPAVVARLDGDRAGGGSDLLFVGRVAPNKCQHDLVKVLAAYRRGFDPRARLRVVGGASSERYRDAIARFAADLGLAAAVDLAGPVDDRALAAYYARADVLVSMSEHEGFCVPIIEAMHHGVPVVAFGAAAVPETLAGAGVLLDTKSPERAAAAVHRVVTDRPTRAALVAAGRERAAAFHIDRTAGLMVDAIATVAGRTAR